MGATLTSSEVLRKLNLSRSTFYYMLKNNMVSVPTTDSGRYIWDEELLASLKEKMASLSREEPAEPPYKTTNINNRRYLGNKYKLLDFIRGTIDAECQDITTVADIFAGTGSVASAFSEKKVFAKFVDI